MAAEIDKQDLITDGALRVPKELADGFTSAEKQLDKLIESVKQHEKLTTEQTATIAKLLKRVDSLEKEQKQLVETTKKLTDQIKKNKKATEEQGAAMEALDNRVGGAIGRFRLLGKELLAIAKNPIVVTLAVIIALVAALTSSVKTFFASTGEGEDMLDRQSAVWKQFFNVLKKGWADIGKSITDFLGEEGSKNGINALFTFGKFLFPFFSKAINKMQQEFNDTADDAVKLADKMNNVEDKVIANIVREARVRKEVNKLILDSQDDIQFNDAQRLKFLEEAIDKQEAQMRVNVEIAKLQRKNLQEEISLRHVKEKNASLTDEENKALAEALAKIISLEGDYYQEVRKNAGKVIKLKEEIRKKDIEAAEAAAHARILSANKEVTAEVERIREQVLDGTKFKTEAEIEIDKFKKKMAASLVAAEILAMQQILAKDNLTKEERAKYAEELYKLEVALNEAYYNSFTDNQEKILGALKDVQRVYEMFAGSVNSIFQSMTDRRLQELDKIEKANEESLERQLKGAGDNEKAKEKIEEKFAKKQEQLDRQRVQLMRRAAVFEKAIAIAQATINTAVAVTALLEFPPLAIAAGIAGALQVAAILAEPLPAYAEGGITKAPWLVAGEEGIEGYRTPGGNIGFTPDHASVVKLPVGTEILPHDETMRAIAMSGMGVESIGTKDDARLLNAFVSGLGKLNRTMKNKKEVHIKFGSRGAEASIKNADNWNKMLGDFYG